MVCLRVTCACGWHCHFARVLRHAGEMKKGVFTLMNYMVSEPASERANQRQQCQPGTVSSWRDFASSLAVGFQWPFVCSEVAAKALLGLLSPCSSTVACI